MRKELVATDCRLFVLNTLTNKLSTTKHLPPGNYHPKIKGAHLKHSSGEPLIVVVEYHFRPVKEG